MPANKPKKMSPDESKLVKTIALNAVKLRKARELTQFDMMDYGFNYRQYQRVESGKYAPTLGTLIRLAKAFKVKVTDLLK
jgi:transcriptional regulator with XRE-family HTH domain